MGYYTVRSSHPKVPNKKGAPKIFTKLTEKHQSWNLFFNKAAGSKTPVSKYFF